MANPQISPLAASGFYPAANGAPLLQARESLSRPASPGVDEAGCAPLAGPVVAAAVILDREKFPRGIDDSKALPAATREAICARLYKVARVGVGLATVEEIDRINIFWARMLAMSRAVDALGLRSGDGPGRRQSLPEMGAPLGLDRRRRHQMPLDRRRLDRRQGHPRPDHERLCQRASRLWLGDQQGLSHARTLSAASTRSARPRSTAEASPRCATISRSATGRRRSARSS